MGEAHSKNGANRKWVQNCRKIEWKKVLEDIDGRMLLQWIVNKWDMRM
jgi:hypothetical protein